VSELIFGGGAVGGLLIDADDDTKRAVIKMAIDGGINWIDTAASYWRPVSPQPISGPGRRAASYSTMTSPPTRPECARSSLASA